MGAKTEVKNRKRRIFHSAPLSSTATALALTNGSSSHAGAATARAGRGRRAGSSRGHQQDAVCATLADIEYLQDAPQSNFKIWRGRETGAGAGSAGEDVDDVEKAEAEAEAESAEPEPAQGAAAADSAKISDLELQLAMLREQVASLVVSQGAAQSAAPAPGPPPPPAGPPGFAAPAGGPPPPPPPPPPVLDMTPKQLVITRNGKSTELLAKKKESGLDMTQVLKQMGSVKLKKVDRSRPKSPVQSSGTDPASLIANALKRKFGKARQSRESREFTSPLSTRKNARDEFGADENRTPSPVFKVQLKPTDGGRGSAGRKSRRSKASRNIKLITTQTTTTTTTTTICTPDEESAQVAVVAAAAAVETAVNGGALVNDEAEEGDTTKAPISEQEQDDVATSAPCGHAGSEDRCGDGGPVSSPCVEAKMTTPRRRRSLSSGHGGALTPITSNDLNAIAETHAPAAVAL